MPLSWRPRRVSFSHPVFEKDPGAQRLVSRMLAAGALGIVDLLAGSGVRIQSAVWKQIEVPQGVHKVDHDMFVRGGEHTSGWADSTGISLFLGRPTTPRREAN